MVEFTERERAVIHLMSILQNPMTKDIPFDLKIQSLMATCLLRKIPFDETTMKDMAIGIDEEIKLTIKEGFGFLAKHPELLQAMKDFKL